MSNDCVECAFLVPQTEASHLGKLPIVRKMLLRAFGGFTQEGQALSGVWKNPAGQVISDILVRFVCAVPDDRVVELRDIVRKLCAAFNQECIYFSVAGRVEFISRDTLHGEYRWNEESECADWYCV